MNALYTWTHNFTKGLLLGALALIFAVLPFGSVAAAAEVEVVNESFDSFDGNEFGDWTFDNVGSYDSDTSSGESPNSVKLSDDTGDSSAVVDLSLDNDQVPAEISFWMKGNSVSSDSVLRVEETDGDGWQESEGGVFTGSDIPATDDGGEFMLDLSTSTQQVRFSYDKEGGNVALDDVVVTATEEDGSAPNLESVDPLAGNVELGHDEDFVWTVDAADEDSDLYSLEIDHSLGENSGTPQAQQLPEFTVYASSSNPYGLANQEQADEVDGLDKGDSLAPVFAEYGAEVSYDDQEEEWEIDFGENITERFVSEGGITFYIVLSDENEETDDFGSMDPTSDENTFAYDIARMEKPVISGEKTEVVGRGEGADISPGSGWEIYLHEYWGESDGVSDAIATTTTGSEGEYSFDDYPDSDYQYIICEENRDGWTQVRPQMLGDESDAPHYIQRGTCDNGTIGHIVVSHHDFNGVDNLDGLGDHIPVVESVYRFENRKDEEETEEPSGGGGGGAPAPSRSSSDDGEDVAGEQDRPSPEATERQGEEDEGEVLGVQTESCEPYLSEYIHSQKVNDSQDVIKLQLFLNTWMETDLAISGQYDDATTAAVEDFQQMYAGDVLAPWEIDGPTGNVYITTMRKINSILCDDVAGQPLPELVPIS